MRWRVDDSVVDQLLEFRPCLGEAELEVQEVQHAGIAGAVTHRLGFGCVAAERFVTQHGQPAVNRGVHMVEVHERRRVDGHQVDPGRQSGLHRGIVTRADHLDVRAETLIHRRSGMLAETGADDHHPHANSPLSPVPPALRASRSRVADRPNGSRRSGWL